MKKINGTKIREARQALGLTTRQTAKLIEEKGIKVHHTSISRWENTPDAKPQEMSIKVLCQVLNISEDEVYFEEYTESVDILSMISKIVSIYKKDSKDERLYEIEKIL